MITQQMFDRHWPAGDAFVIAGMLAAQGEVVHRFDLVTSRRWAHFLGQMSVECLDGTHMHESLSYTHARALMRAWPKRFPTLDVAMPYLRNPKKLADYVYGDRLGNRPGTDDGWNFRGRGLIGLTGRDNYVAIGKATGLDLESNPDLANTPENALIVAAAIWQRLGANAAADTNSATAVTHRINGGNNGLSERFAATVVWAGELGCENPAD